MSSLTYSKLVETLTKLHKCYRAQGALTSDIISTIDFYSKPYASLALSSLLWMIDLLKRRALSYSDVIYMQRNVAMFLTKASKEEMEFLKRLIDLMPTRFGLDITIASRRCLIEQQMLADTIKLLNMLNDVLTAVSSSTPTAFEDRRKSKIPCLNVEDFLPSTNAIAKTLIRMVLDKLKTSKNLYDNPYFIHVLSVIEDKIKNDVKIHDIVALALILITVLRSTKSTQVCIEPGIDAETLCRKIYNDLTYAGADPASSDIYSLYQELSSRNVINK